MGSHTNRFFINIKYIPVNPDEFDGGDEGLSSNDLDLVPVLDEDALRKIEGMVEELENPEG